MQQQPSRALVLLAGLCATAAALAAACRSSGPQRPEVHGAVLVHGGQILVDAFASPVEALLAINGRVVMTGSDAEVQRAAAGLGVELTDEIDLAGAWVVPGLQDAHGHIESYGAGLEALELRGVRSYPELVELVTARAAELEPGTWITGRGWDHTLWPGSRFPDQAALSAAVPDHPVLLRRVDGHAALANARALASAGIDVSSTAAVPQVVGGEVLVDDAGRPTGMLIDTAMGLVSSSIPEPDRAARRRHILLAQQALLAVGLTCVHDMGVTPATIEIYEELAREGLLELRVVAYLWGNEQLDEQVLRRFRGGYACGAAPIDRLYVPGVKLMADGALGSRGAALLADYSDRPGSRGLLRFEPEEFRELVATYARAGLQPATHAIGDAANRMVLDAYEQVMGELPAFAARLPRVEHAQVVAPEDLGRFESLGVVASVQPTHATTDMRWVAERVGPERVLGAYAWLALDPARGGGLKLALGSDFPVERPDPLEGLYAARTRQDSAGHPRGGFQPDQRLDGSQALHGFTAGAARAALQAQRRGRLQEGWAADLTILDLDPVTCAPEALLGARVLGTMIDGKLVYRSEQL